MEEEITTETLLAELRQTATDLARVVEGVLRRKMPLVVVSEAAVAAWEERAPEAWAKVRQWLARQGITLRIV